jgi:hypothetical protein
MRWLVLRAISRDERVLSEARLLAARRRCLRRLARSARCCAASARLKRVKSGVGGWVIGGACA